MIKRYSGTGFDMRGTAKILMKLKWGEYELLILKTVDKIF